MLCSVKGFFCSVLFLPQPTGAGLGSSRTYHQHKTKCNIQNNQHQEKFSDEWESIFFNHATCLPHGTGGDFCGATNPVGSTDARGRDQCLKSRFVCGILPENAWKFLQLCHLFCCDSVPNDNQPKRGVCYNECCSELVSEFSAPFTTEPVFLETIGCVGVKDVWHESFVAIL